MNTHTHINNTENKEKKNRFLRCFIEFPLVNCFSCDPHCYIFVGKMKDLDLTLDYMENARFNYTYGPQVNSMKALFSKTELLCLAMIYNKFTLQNQARANFLTRAQLATILELMFQVRDMDIKSRIVACISLDPECTDPKFSYEHHCTLNSFIRMFAIYFSTDLEKRIQFTFTVSECFLITQKNKLSQFPLDIRWWKTRILGSWSG